MSSRQIDTVIRRFGQEIDAANRDMHQLRQTVMELEQALEQIDRSGMRPDARLTGELRRLGNEVKELQTRTKQLMSELADTDRRVFKAMM